MPRVKKEVNKMKILLFLNNDIHSATALNLLFPALKNHEVKIILSQKVGNVDGLPLELLEMKKHEQNFDQKIFKKFAKFFGHEIATYESVNSENALDDFRKFAPDLAISIRFGQIFKQLLINIPRFGVLNLHSGLLPNYRGILGTFWAILHGEKEIGTTLHFINDSGIDTGKIIGFSKNKIDGNLSLLLNINNLYKSGCELISQSLEKIQNGEENKAVDQSMLGNGQYFSYPKSDDVKKFLALMPLARIGDDEKILESWN